MSENQEKIDQLIEQFNSIFERHELFSEEITKLRTEILSLKETIRKEERTSSFQDRIETSDTAQPVIQEIEEQTKPIISPEQFDKQGETYERETSRTDSKPEAEKSFSIEKFIGENLISKIGIAITIIGVGIGVKYSIDHHLISPLTRILLGYLVGLGLLGTGAKLKNKYENYSAVLVSGAMSILYFITYFAYSFYDLMPQVAAFGLMVVITIATVYAALKYNKQVIAHIGLVGAYAVPFLLSKNSGNAAVLFSYISIINIGILVISFKKDWNPLYYASFLLSWIIYLVWLNTSYQNSEHFALALIFAFLFYVIFYTTFLAYNLYGKSTFYIDDRFLLLANSTLFFGIGYYLLQNNEDARDFSGLFAVGNAVINLAVSLLVYKRNLADKNLFYFVSSLVIIFITIAIPAQFDGNWITVLWVTEAALIFWIGRTKSEPVYEKLSYPLLILAFISLSRDWATGYHLSGINNNVEDLTPILNLCFLNSMLFTGSLSFINYFYFNKKYKSALHQIELRQLFDFLTPAILIFTIYFGFRFEIASYFRQLNLDSVTGTQDMGNGSVLLKFKSLWMSIYTMVFLAALSFSNILKLKNRALGSINLSVNAIVILIFLINDLYLLGTLRQIYLEQSLPGLIHKSHIYITFRYISFVFVAFLLFTTYKYINQAFIKYKLKVEFDLLLYGTIIWITSSELINWMDLLGSDQSYKLGLSILWGVYSLGMISLGIWKKKKHLRIGAIVLFGATLIKLFFYDISQLDTIPKTIVFVSLGLLLLIISFLYNKYKDIIL